VAALLLASCFGDSTGPRGLHRAQFAIAPLFDARALDAVAFDRIRIRFVPAAGGGAVVDTVVDFPSTADSIALSLSVPVTGSSETFTITLAMINSAGDTVFRGGPSSVTALPGTFATAPTDVPIFYTGVGFDAASVRFTGTPPATAFFGDTAAFGAEAVDSAGHPIAGTPIVFRVAAADSALARVANPDAGRVIAKTARGSAHVVAELLTHQTATTSLLVQPRPNAIAFTSGSGQTGTVGSALGQPLTARVTAADNLGVAGVVVTFAVTAGGGNLSATSDTTDAGGSASVVWTLGPTAGAQTVTATAGALTTNPVSAIAAPGTATKLAFALQPSNATAGGAVAPAVQVVAQDADGNTASAFTGNVTVALAANPGAAVLSGTVTVAAVSGVATFGTLSLDKASAGYTLAAAAAGLTGATSAPFNVTAGAAATLALLSGAAQSGSPGAPLAQPVVVKVTDAHGNAVAGRAVTFAVATGGGSVGTPSANTDADGAASTTWTLGAVGGSQSITATATGLAGSPLTVTATAQTGVPAQVAFLVQPSNAVAGFSLTPAVVVAVQDSNGVTVTTFTGLVGVALATNPDSATLSGTVAVNAVAGIATFANLSVDKADTGYALGAAISVSIGGFSNHFTITAGAAKTLALHSGGGQAGAQSTPLALPVVVKVTDSLGNAVSGTAVTFAIQAGGGSVGTPNATTSASGLASTTWTLGAAAGAQSITATSAGLTGSPLTIGATAGAGVASTTVTPHLDTLTALTATFALAAQAKDALGSPMSGSFTWTSRTPAVATVNVAGLVTAVTNGSTWVVAAEAGGTRDSALIVVQQRIATITVTPGARSLFLTTTFAYSAAAVDGLGKPMPGVTAFTWTSTAPAVATVDTAGHVSAVGLGSTQIRATANAVTGVGNLNVLTPITRIAVVVDTAGAATTDTVALASLGLQRRYRAIAHDTLDAPMAGVSFAWASSNPSVAVLDSITATTARATSAANGVTRILATAQGLTAAPGASLTVQQVLAAITLTPASPTIGIAGTVGLVAHGLDANGRYISGGAFRFRSSVPAVATVDSLTGVVTGVALGITAITATGGPIVSNSAFVTVGASVPAALSFGRDTLSVGRGGSTSVPILLSTPAASPLIVKLAVQDTFAFWTTATVTIPAGQTAVNAQLNGRNAGTTVVTAGDSSGLGYAPTSAVLAVTATMRLASGSYAINAMDVAATQVLLSDPSPAGGTYVTFGYSTPGIAAISPDPAFIPAGQLAADIQIRGLAGGSTNITPNAIGVNGTASSFTAYPPVLTPSQTSIRLGAGQFDPNTYVYAPTYTATPIPVTLASTDSTVAVVPPAVTIPQNSYYAYFNVSGGNPGTATVSVASPGWTAARTVPVTVTSPFVGISGGGALNTTSPQTTVTVYAEDSLRTAHYRTSSLVVRLSSSDTTVMKVLDTVVTIAPGQYYNGTARVIPGGLGGSAYIFATAGGHQGDSTQFTVVGPKLEFSWQQGRVGAGQYDPNLYVYTPNNVTAPLVVAVSNSNPASVSLPAADTIPTSSYYRYFTVAGVAPGSATFIASAAGYQGDTAGYAVTSPRLTATGSTTYNDFGPGGNVTVYATDSLRTAHYRSAPLLVSVVSTDTNVVKVDSATVTIDSGTYYNSRAHVTPVGVGTAHIIFTAAGHLSLDTLTITVQTPKLNFSFFSATYGRRQRSGPTDLYIYTPDNRATPLDATITQRHAAVDTLTKTSPVIPAASYYDYFDVYALANGVDTLIVTAPGYLPDTAYVTVTTPKFTTSGLPGSTTTTNPPIGVYLYATDSVGTGHYVSDTLVVAAVSSDTTVIRPTQPYFRIPAGAYYAYTTVTVVGPGAASITYSDSAGTGYLPATTNSMTVTGPSLALSNGAPVLGMRQSGGPNASYVYTPNNVAAPLVVHLVSTGTRVATVPDSVIVPTGSYYAYFTVSAQDTVGTIQIQAAALGYNAASMNVQVTVPKFVLSTAGQLNTTSARTSITVYATDANGTAHYPTENVTVTLQSSAPGVAAIDSSTVTIPAGSYYVNTPTWGPGTVGTAQLSAEDVRAAQYKYGTGTANVAVVTPTLSLNSAPGALGIGQYQDYVYGATPDNQTAPLSVTLTHSGTARTGTFTNLTNAPITGLTIPSGSYYQYFRVTGLTRGTDTLVASAASPLHNPATMYTVVDSGRVDPIGGWPGSIKAGDSVLVTLYSRDPSDNPRNVVGATAFTLAPSANIEFRQGGAVVTTVTVPADAQSVQFYLKGVSAGSGSVTITNADYKSYFNTVTVTP
jgi:hypothetical protein